MTKLAPTGTCSLCSGTFNKSVMTKHLASCRQKETPKTPSGKGGGQKTKILHLVVEGRYQPEYWLHIEAKANATLGDVDDFLRETWLECCGHMSAFRIEGQTYSIAPMAEVDDEGMDYTLGELVRPKMKFQHEYDFGTTTHLALKVVSERESETRGKAIRLLARNEPLLITCESCGKLARQVCSQCIYSGEGWVCDDCAPEHECGDEMMLPVVNSPRVGMCGYTG
jgi:hypothetical protein